MSENTPKKHRIRWFVVVNGERYPREATMRGYTAFEATCSCGWDSKTGGAVRSAVEHAVWEHKFDVEHGYWDEDAKKETYR
jgi:hypothetical protein